VKCYPKNCKSFDEFKEKFRAWTIEQLKRENLSIESLADRLSSYLLNLEYRQYQNDDGEYVNMTSKRALENGFEMSYTWQDSEGMNIQDALCASLIGGGGFKTDFMDLDEGDVEC
jgi:hypothetical protein